MRKVLCGVGLLAIVGAAMLITGCASPYPQGVIYTDLTLPAIATANAQSPKVGTAECTSILALVAMGDASIAAAAKNGGITKIHSVDWEANNILGIIGKYKTIVRGE
jgi:hypothetical protein